ncbi:peptidoglycan-binding protein [Rhizobium sp. T1470]|uniref:peptidoglycan-binding protein n=1 Tax=unclassified Rhizobium TaxID=2613769 RepID=UPI001AAE7359|nr:peptidoglycan-binding protein [Rhizobium sp. T1473]MCA0800563.1 peptidoglycan-binding protein [Rhizobium sp. T1473]
MNGSRSNSPRHSDRASLDALNRTIEGLEARIEGLIGTGARDQRQRPPAPERESYADPYAARAPHGAEARPDPFAEIRQRQRILEASRERPPLREPASYTREQPASSRAPLPVGEHAPRSAAAQPAAPQPAYRVAEDTMTEIAQALVNLRQDLKRDISEGVTREMNALREEIRSIKVGAEDRRFADDIRADMSRLASSIDQLAGHSNVPEVQGLRGEFEELRSLMDGLAREDSIRHMETRWDGFEHQLHALDTAGLQEELVAFAYRLDDIKRHIGGMGESPAVRALEDKLISIATAMEQFGSMIQPHDRAMAEQFAAMDSRLDEISRAIAATGRTAASGDPAMMHRLEGRLNALGEQIDMMGHSVASRAAPADGLADRLETLTLRVEELANAEATSRLDERLEHLSFLLERSHKAAPQPELTGALADISRKIDALEVGSVNDALAQRLDYLARRIDEMDFQPLQPVAAPVDDSAFRRIESRLGDIVARLEESTAASAADPYALKNLEDQIANLSALMSEPRPAAELPAEFDRRMGAIEDYMATSDEYIIEAARQAAEAVVEAYARSGALQGGAPAAADMSALNALAEDLRQLEDLSRSSDERTHRTFQALHETLVQIAERLDTMEDRAVARPAPRMPAADVEFAVDTYAMMQAGADDAQKPAVFGTRAPASRQLEVAEEAPAVPVMAATDTSAIAIEAATKPASSAGPSKGSLLAGLGKRLLPSKKAKVETAAAERTLIDPAPSIDPVDVMPPEAANEPLEPGSGAPDIKKILERVRASQNSVRTNVKPATENERADYIAAARRAAQAAALETEPSAKPQPVKAEKKAKDKDAVKGSAFSRFRRPILLAVGAVLLAIMAFPLARTLTSGQPAPSAEVAVLTDSSSNALPPDSETAPDQAEATAPEVPAAKAPIAPLASADPIPAPAAPDHLTATAPLNGDAAAPLAPSGTSQDASGFVAKDTAPVTAAMATAPAAPATETAGIAIPDVVQPKSLADAAKSGDALALFEIGARYSEGRAGITVDPKEAISWYQLAADKGFAQAEYRLGNIYEKGTGIDRDIAKAKQYYEQAANQGNASAMHNLAVLYASGALGQQDYKAAADWFVKAANLGITDSQFNLAILCARGNGVAQDLTESYRWFAIAAKGGDKDASQKRDEVANAMKPDQLQTARAKADLWKAAPLDSKANGVDVPDEWVGNATKTSTVDMKKAIRNIQAILNNNGFDAGQPDGEMGAKTVAAIKNFQKSIGQEPSGKINDVTVKALLERNKGPATKV